jgi:spore germination protein GerM
MAMTENAAKWKPALILGGLGIVLVVLLYVFFTGGEKESIRRASDTAVAKPQPSAPEPAPRKTVTLLFLSEADDMLHREERDIAAGPSDAAEAERLLAEIIKGSDGDLVSPLPPETRVRQVFVTKDGVAYVDFGREIMEKYSYGSSSELSAIYAVVDALAFNFKSIKRVAILVEGAERETLGGHVDLTRPFVPDFSILAK